VDQAVSFNTLKEEVTFIIEDEIQRCALEFDMAEEEVLNLQIQQWGKFYSSCVHYHEVKLYSLIKVLFMLSEVAHWITLSACRL
jgi:hypothetical protein